MMHVGETESLCPVCFKRIKAIQLPQDDDVFMVKECGVFRTVMLSCCGENNPDLARAEGALDLDVFLQEMVTGSFTISAMAFQDAENIDLERLRGCCISVVSHDGRLIPFCAYNLTSREGKSLYRPQNGSGS